MIDLVIETLTKALEVKRQVRLDTECVARQRKKVEEIREMTRHDLSQEFYWRQELKQHVDRWHDARRIRDFLEALKAAIDSGQWQPKDKQRFGTWFDWATRFADSIDPIVNRHLPESRPLAPQNISIDNLDLTAATRVVVAKLGIEDTNTLWKQQQDAIRKVCEGKFGPVWNEITRVLKGLGYDVSTREAVNEWW